MNSIIKVGDGLGFVIEGKESYVITAAENVPEQEPEPESYAPRNEEEAAAIVVEDDEETEEFYQKICGTIEGKQNVSAVCVYRNEFIAILTSTKKRRSPVERAKFEELVEEVTPLQVARPPKPRGVDTGIFWVRPAPNESVRATIIPLSMPSSRNA